MEKYSYWKSVSQAFLEGLSAGLVIKKSWFIFGLENYHHGVLTAQIALTLAHLLSLLVITLDKFSNVYTELMNVSFC